MKKRFFAFGISFLFLFLSAWVSVGQQTTLSADPAKTFRQANLFFQSKNFIAAREEFIQYLTYLQQQNNPLHINVGIPRMSHFLNF